MRILFYDILLFYDNLSIINPLVTLVRPTNEEMLARLCYQQSYELFDLSCDPAAL